MSESPSNDPQERRGVISRFSSEVRTDADDIQDWLNGSGAMVMGAILVFIGLFSLYAIFFG